MFVIELNFHELNSLVAQLLWDCFTSESKGQSSKISRIISYADFLNSWKTWKLRSSKIKHYTILCVPWRHFCYSTLTVAVCWHTLTAAFLPAERDDTGPEALLPGEAKWVVGGGERGAVSRTAAAKKRSEFAKGSSWITSSIQNGHLV